jgi:hypothetical protein
MALVDVPTELLPEPGEVEQFNIWDRSTFFYGSQFLEDAREVSRETEQLFSTSYRKQLISDRQQLLLIGLVDLFTANEDRHGSNYNMLLSQEDGYHFIPIDHGACFNSKAALNHDLVSLSQNESLLDSPLVKQVFNHSRNKQETFEHVKESFSQKVVSFAEVAVHFLVKIPDGWKPEYEKWRHLLLNQMLKDDWIHQNLNYFDQLCSQL